MNIFLLNYFELRINIKYIELIVQIEEGVLIIFLV